MEKIDVHVQLVRKGQHERHLNQHRGYRYIDPRQGLENFYGVDRSFCMGLMFDACDFIIEFVIHDWSTIQPIIHHPSSYRGPLRPDNVAITGIYFRDPPIDYDQINFEKYLKILYQQVSEGVLFYQYQYQNQNQNPDNAVMIEAIWRKK